MFCIRRLITLFVPRDRTCEGGGLRRGLRFDRSTSIMTVMHGTLLTVFALVLGAHGVKAAVTPPDAAPPARSERTDETVGQKAIREARAHSRTTYADWEARDLAAFIADFAASHRELVERGEIQPTRPLQSWFDEAAGERWREPTQPSDLTVLDRPETKECSDPFLHYLLARQAYFGSRPEDASRHAIASLDFILSPAGAHVRPLSRLHMLIRLRTYVASASPNRLTREFDARIMAAIVTATGHLVAAHGVLLPESRVPRSEDWWRGRIAFGRAIAAMQLPSAARSSGQTIQQARELADLAGLDPWFAHALRTFAERTSAWNARGSRLASQTPPEDFERAGEAAEAMLAAAELAWALDPSRPEPAALACDIGFHGGGFGESFSWFLRAISASSDWSAAYDSIARQLMPRWGGSVEGMIAFATDSYTLATDDEASCWTVVGTASKLLEEEMAPADVANHSSFGPLLVRAVDNALRLQKAKSSATSTGSVATTATVVAMLRDDWSRAQECYKLANPLDTQVMNAFGFSEGDLTYALAVRRPDEAGEDERAKALAAEAAGRWDEATQLWKDAMRAKASPSVAMAAARHFSRCNTFASIRASKVVSLSASEAFRLQGWHWDRKVQSGRIALIGDYDRQRDGSLSPSIALLRIAPEGDWTATVTLDMEQLAPVDPDVSAGFALGASELGPAHVAVHVRPTARRITVTHEFWTQEPALADIDASDMIATGTVTLRVLMKDNIAHVAARGSKGDFTEVWTGPLPKRFALREGGDHIGLSAKVPYQGRISFANLTLQQHAATTSAPARVPSP